MGKEAGYIKLYRSLQNNWIWEDPVYAWRFIDLLFMVNYEKKESICRKNRAVVTIDRGETWTTLRALADRWHCSVKAARYFLNLLIKEKMVTMQGTPSGTFVKVLNYELYQGFDTPSGANKRNKAGHTEETIGKQSGTTTKESNTLNKDKEINIRALPPPGFGGEWE